MNNTEVLWPSDAEITIAYRKAKADLFNSQRVCYSELAQFEEDLNKGISRIRKLLQNPITFGKRRFWSYSPQKISVTKNVQEQGKRRSSKRLNNSASFRIVERMPIEAHVISILWIEKIGRHIENRIGSHAKGNRLREASENENQDFLINITTPYFKAYRDWQKESISEIRSAVDKNENVTVLITDISAFYHNIDPKFLLNETVKQKLGIGDLSIKEKNLHETFISLLSIWAKSTPLKTGIPVGLTASSLIANAYLFEFDEIIQTSVRPIYYARYVDDVVLVMHSQNEHKSLDDVWNWLNSITSNFEQFRPIFSSSANGNGWKYSSTFIKEDEIIFSEEKSDAYFLTKENGNAIADIIQKTLNTRTSEWRTLSTIPDNSDAIKSSIYNLANSKPQSSFSLRSGEDETNKRAKFSILLREFETYSKQLPSASWSEYRHKFYESFISDILKIETFSDYYTYYPRVISLAVNQGDFEFVIAFEERLSRIFNDLSELTLSIKGTRVVPENILDELHDEMRRIINESVEFAFPDRKKLAELPQWYSYCRRKGLDPVIEKRTKLLRMRKLLRCDCAFQPLKSCFLPIESRALNYRNYKLGELVNTTIEIASSFAPEELLDATIAASPKFTNDELEFPSGLLFPTRPFSIPQAYLLIDDPFSTTGISRVRSLLYAFRGINALANLPRHISIDDKDILEFPSSKDHEGKVRISIASWKTETTSWNASVLKDVDPDISRFNRLNQLIDDILKCKIKPHYVIFPELAIPAHRFEAIADKLCSVGISLISGIEYIHTNNTHLVRNQVWASFACRINDQSSYAIYRQDKQRPAQHEGEEIWRLGGKIFAPPKKKWSSPPIISHCDFYFAILICSELTNISYRASVRGYVDAIFVPEWNKDVDYFASLIESSALDIHAYVIQCNHRDYGDSRIRAPGKESWERDLVRIKGGISDYHVIGEIDYYKLREFQTFNVSPGKYFKPIPDGYIAASYRKRTPYTYDFT